MSKAKPIQLSIPQPCHEDWAQMTPDERGRFCSHCQKSVVDFTTWTDSQIHQYITAYAGERICGRVHITQTDRLLYPVIPLRKRPAAMQWLAPGVVLLLAISPLEMKAIAHDNITVISEMQDDDMSDSAADSITISGIVLDERKQPAFGAIVVLTQKGKEIGGAATNEGGSFSITLHASQLRDNDIDMRVSFTSYKMRIIQGIPRNKNTYHNVQLELNPNATLDEGMIWAGYIVPLIDPFEPTKRIITSEEIEKMAR